MLKFKEYLLKESHKTFLKSPIIFYALFVEKEHFDKFEKEIYEIIINNQDNEIIVKNSHKIVLKYYPNLVILKEDLFEIDLDDPALNIIKRYCLEPGIQIKARIKLFIKSFLRKENYKFTTHFNFYQGLFNEIIVSFPTARKS